MSKIAITYNAKVSGATVYSLKKSFSSIGCEVVDIDYREMMRDIPLEEFDEAYKRPWGRGRLFAHAKYAAESFLSNVDCLVIPGNSAMIDPDLFNQERIEGQCYDFSRTLAELALVHVAMQRGMPIMGVCGGHQVAAVYGGGTIRDLKVIELEKQGFINYDVIYFKDNSLIKQIISSAGPITDTPLEQEFFGAHSQAVEQLGKGFIKTAMSSDKNVIEAAETECGAPVITTQFHPEVAVYGVPNYETLYKKDEAAVEISLKLFNFFGKAGEVYKNKKNLNNEIEDKVGKLVLTQIQKLKIQENIFYRPSILKEQGVKKTIKKAQSEEKINFIYPNFIGKLLEKIKSFFRKSISYIQTLKIIKLLKKRDKRNGLQEKPLRKLSSSTEKILTLQASLEYQLPKMEKKRNFGFTKSLEKEKRNPMQTLINEPAKKWVKKQKNLDDKLLMGSIPAVNPPP